MRQTAATTQPVSSVSDIKTLFSLSPKCSDTLKILTALTGFDLLFFLIPIGQ